MIVPVACGIEAEPAGDQIGVAFIGPHQLRHAKAAERPGRRPVGVDLEGIDRDVVDVVGAGGGEAGFLRDARADIGIGAAIVEDLAMTGGEAAVLVDRALDAKGAGVPADREELFLQGQRDLDRPAGEH
jgi:hypothetical protein